ncbi:hypothetical protein [Caballeronia sp. Sq4a]|uniref:hypothetical protein n=1 Tax=Caballeronia sp. Sq4a TaxID=2878152 RepID=UPI0020BF6415|nr:hypothetical protein [Caballeronia sp. Sq4a]
MNDEQIKALRKASAVLCGTGHHDEASTINGLLAASASAEPEFSKVVPHEPTKEMLEAGREQLDRMGFVNDVWQAMYCAAPRPIEAPDNSQDAPVSAFQVLKDALKNDAEYAWAWHCNLAMPIMDAVRCTPAQANKAGADLMQYLFDIDIRKHPHWQHAAPATEAPAQAVAAIRALYIENPPDELGPSDESQYRDGYNTALEDAADAIAALSAPASMSAEPVNAKLDEYSRKHGFLSLAEAVTFAVSQREALRPAAPSSAENRPAQDDVLTDEQIDRLIVSACHSDPRMKNGEYCLTIDEMREILAIASQSAKEPK